MMKLTKKLYKCPCGGYHPLYVLPIISVIIIGTVISFCNVVLDKNISYWYLTLGVLWVIIPALYDLFIEQVFKLEDK